MTAVLFGTFNARHAANALLEGDLRRAGIDLRLCHEPLWEETRDKDERYFSPLGLARLALRYAATAARLRRRFRAEARAADVLIAGFNGQLDVLLLRRLAGRRPIVFAPLVTVSETLIDDRATYAPGSPAARLLARLDRAALSAADLVVLDTAAHREFVARRLGPSSGRVLVHYLGAESIFAPRPERASEVGAVGDRARLRVLFYGQYLPLHGTEVIARAAASIDPSAGIEFELFGTGPGRAACEAIVRRLPHVRLTDWIAYADLPARIAAADVVLGIFGSSEKAHIVVPNKVYQAAQVGRPIVTADTPAIREVFAPGESIYAIAPEKEALAGALIALAADPALRARLGQAARAAVARVAAPEIRATRLGGAIAELCRTTKLAARGGAEPPASSPSARPATARDPNVARPLLSRAAVPVGGPI